MCLYLLPYLLASSRLIAAILPVSLCRRMVMKWTVVSICVMVVIILPSATRWTWRCWEKSLRRVHGDYRLHLTITSVINSVAPSMPAIWWQRRVRRICPIIPCRKTSVSSGVIVRMPRLIRTVRSLPVWTLLPVVMTVLVWVVCIIRNSILRIPRLPVWAIRGTSRKLDWIFQVHSISHRIRVTLLWVWRCPT